MSTRLQALCEQLKLMTPATEFANLADHLAAKETSLLGYLEAALKHEIDIRVGRSRHTLTKLAGFPSIKTLDGYDFEFATGAPKQRLIELAGMAFVERRENVILLGPSGTEDTLGHRTGLCRCPGRL